MAVMVELAGMCNGAHLFTLGRQAPIADELSEIRRLALHCSLSSALQLHTLCNINTEIYKGFLACNPGVTVSFIDKFIHFGEEVIRRQLTERSLVVFVFGGRSLFSALIKAHSKGNQTTATFSPYSCT